MGPLILSLMSLLSQANIRPWIGDSSALRSGHALYNNPTQSSFENNIGNGIYPTYGNGIPIIIAIDTPEPKPRSSYSPDMIRIPIEALPMSFPSFKTSELRDIPQTRRSLNPDFIQTLMDAVPLGSPSFRAPYARLLSQPRNPEIIPINMNDLPSYFQNDFKEMPLSRFNTNPEIPSNSDLVKIIMDVHPQTPESPEPKGIFQSRNVMNPDFIQMVVNSMPMSPKSIAPESRELSSPGLSLFDMLADVPETSSPPPSISEKLTPNNFDSVPLANNNNNNNGLFDFPMFNYGRSMDTLPMAVSYQVPPVLPPLVPAMNITAMTMCENSMIVLSCPIGQTIHFVSVFYGRTSMDICTLNTSGSDFKNYNTTTCILSSAMSTMENLCEGQNTCKMTSNNSVFGEDPCPGIVKYMQISYYCR